MVSISQQIDTSHDDMIHDAVTNYFGNRLATCSSDRTIKLFAISGNSHIFLSELRGHDGPVWQLAWAHPMFGNLLASCSYDRKVIIWKETAKNSWERAHEYTGHDSSVNSIDWAPKEFGLQLVCGSSDGAISILSCVDNIWNAKKLSNTSSVGVNAVAWVPSFAYGLSLLLNARDDGDGGSLEQDSVSGSLSKEFNSGSNRLQKRFASGGCDNLVKIWLYDEKDDNWNIEHQLEGHTDWIRDLAWAPTIGNGRTRIASCSHDRKVIIWELQRSTSGELNWQPKPIGPFNDVVWHVSWSPMGNILAVSGGDNKVTIWKEDPAGAWRCISDVDSKSS